jgi:chorismate mutase
MRPIMMSIKKLRNKIDKIDADIIKKISHRNTISKKIGQLKVKLNRKVIDKKREEQLILRYKKLCHQYEINPILVNKLFKLIIAHSRKLQRSDCKDKDK